MRAFCLAIVLLGAAACTRGRFGAQPFVGELPGDTALDLHGRFALTRRGDVMLYLARPCVMVEAITPTRRYVGTACDRARRDAIRVVATTPWGTSVAARWRDAYTLVFRVDWERSAAELRCADTSGIAARPWQVSGARWTPSAEEAARMVLLIHAARERNAWMAVFSREAP